MKRTEIKLAVRGDPDVVRERLRAHGEGTDKLSRFSRHFLKSEAEASEDCVSFHIKKYHVRHFLVPPSDSEVAYSHLLFDMFPCHEGFDFAWLYTDEGAYMRHDGLEITIAKNVTPGRVVLLPRYKCTSASLAGFAAIHEELRGLRKELNEKLESALEEACSKEER